MPTLKKNNHDWLEMRPEVVPEGTPVLITRLDTTNLYPLPRAQPHTVIEGVVAYYQGKSWFAMTKEPKLRMFRASVHSWQLKSRRVGRFVP